MYTVQIYIGYTCTHTLEFHILIPSEAHLLFKDSRVYFSFSFHFRNQCEACISPLATYTTVPNLQRNRLTSVG